MIYDGAGFKDLAATVRNATEDIRPYRSEFDSIVVRGLSGTVVGSPVSLRLRKPLVVVRKEIEIGGLHSHASNLVENRAQVGLRYLWLDDFVSSGATRVETWRGVAFNANADAKMVLEYLYRDRTIQPAELCNVWGCNAATRYQFQTCDNCANRSPFSDFWAGSCACRSNYICGRGDWQA